MNFSLDIMLLCQVQASMEQLWPYHQTEEKTNPQASFLIQIETYFSCFSVFFYLHPANRMDTYVGES